MANFFSNLGQMITGTKPKTTQTSQPTLLPEQEALMKQLIASFSGQSMTGGQFTQMSPAENTSLAGLEQLAMNMAQPGGEGEDSLQRILSDQNGFTPNFGTSNAGLDILRGAAGGGGAGAPQIDRSFIDALTNFAGTSGEGFEDFYRSNVRDPLIQDFNENVLPQIARQFGGADYFSSDRGDVVNRASQDLVSALTQGRNQALLGAREQTMQALSAGGELSLGADKALIDALMTGRGLDIQAGSAIAGTGLEQQKLMADSFLTGRGQDIQASGLLEQLSQSGDQNALQALTALFSAGGQQRNLATAERDKMLQALMAILGIKGKDNTVVAQPGSPGLLQGFISGAGQGFGMGLGGAAACWVAEELYGVDSPKTHQLRAFVLRHMEDKTLLGWFCRVYSKHGVHWSMEVRMNPLMRDAALKLWDKLFLMSQEEIANG